MPLSHEQANKLAEWMDSRGVNRNCPICGSGHSETGEIVSGTCANNSDNVTADGASWFTVTAGR